jgi:hypothetical protein
MYCEFSIRTHGVPKRRIYYDRLTDAIYIMQNTIDNERAINVINPGPWNSSEMRLVARECEDDADAAD